MKENIFPRFSCTRRQPQNAAEVAISLALRKMDNISVEAKNNGFLSLELRTVRSCFKLFALEQN